MQVINHSKPRVYNDAERAVMQYLASQNISFKAIHTGTKTDKNKWRYDAWLVIFQGVHQTESFDYKTGMGCRYLEHSKPHDNGPLTQGYLDAYSLPLAPSSASVLYSLLLDSSAQGESFDNWCDNYGYDNDSISARGIYDACIGNARKLNSLLTSEQKTHISELLQDY